MTENWGQVNSQRLSSHLHDKRARSIVSTMQTVMQTALPVDYGFPSGGLAMIVLALVALGILKLALELWRRGQKTWFVIFVIAALAFVVFYIQLSQTAYYGNITWVRGANSIVILLSILSGCWMAIDWLRPRRKP